MGHLAFKTVLIAAHDPQSSHYKRVNDLLSHLSDVAAEDLVQYALVSLQLCSSSFDDDDDDGVDYLPDVLILMNIFRQPL